MESGSEGDAHGYSADVRAVLPSIRKSGGGSIILINSATSVKSRAGFAGASLAFPAEGAYGEMLHEALAEEGIRVSQLVIPGGIPHLQFESCIDDVAERMWQIHSAAGDFRTMLTLLDDGRE